MDINTPMCGLLDQETSDYSHTIHISNTSTTVENKDLAHMLNYTNDMITKSFKLLKQLTTKKKVSKEPFTGYHIHKTINMNKIKLHDIQLKNTDYNAIIYDAFVELQKKQLEGVISEVELQEYYEKHHLIINYFRSSETTDSSSDISLSSENEEIIEEQSLLIAGFEEGEASSTTHMDTDEAKHQKFQKEYQRFNEEYNKIKLQKEQLEHLAKQQQANMATLQAQMDELKKNKDPEIIEVDSTPISLTNIPIQYLNIDKYHNNHIKI